MPGPAPGCERHDRPARQPVPGTAKRGARFQLSSVRASVADLTWPVTTPGRLDPWEDARIEAEVKARLVREKAANLTRLGVVSSQATRLSQRHRRIRGAESAGRGAGEGG